MLEDERESWWLLLDEAKREGEFTEMSDNWFVQHPEVMEFILKHERSEHEKLEQDLLDSHLTIDLYNVYTNKIGQASLTVSCYDEQSQHEFYF